MAYGYENVPQNIIDKTLNHPILNYTPNYSEDPDTYYRDSNGRYNQVYKGFNNDYYYIDPKTLNWVQIKDKSTFTRPDGYKINKGIIDKVGDIIRKGAEFISNPSSITKASKNGAGGSGGKSGGYSANNAYYDNMMQDLKNRINALENPKVYTADELAELYGVKDLYDYNKILQMYNDASNKYYTDAIANQEQFNREAQLSNDIYINDILNNYANSYENAAQTAATRGTVAANLLQTMLGSSQTNEEYASNLNSIVNQYRENWKQELANNPILANDYYNSIGKALLNYGADRNTAEVQNFINHLNAYTTEYAGIRNAQSTLANAAANAYQSKANAALARNASDASWNMWNAYQAYYNQYGKAAGSQEYKDAANAYIYNTNTESQRYTPSTSVK